MSPRKSHPIPSRRPNAKRPVYTVAPVAANGSDDYGEPKTETPREPPSPLPIAPEPPVFRPLKVYAFDSSLGKAPGNVMTIPVRYEKLRPGPVGERVAVIDYDASRDCFYDPVDLDDPLIAIRGGLDPSESDPHFHQQMAYAVACETLRRTESALGRTVRRRSATGAAPLRFYIYPHARRVGNAYSTYDGDLMFGYFRAAENATGRTIPGQTVFTCLSHDVIVHTAMHTIIGATRPDLISPDPVNRERYCDLNAFHEGLCDIVALLLHFSYREAVLDAIQRTAGSIYRSLLAADRDSAAGGPLIQAETAAGNPLLTMGQGFGEAVGQTEGLRSALGQKPDPGALHRVTEAHERGGILVAAIFDAFFSIYVRRTQDLFRIYRAGGGRIDGGDLPTPLAQRLCAEVDGIAARMFNVCMRALDYCPACNMALGDFLRACITADYEYSPDDEWGIRDAFMQAFRRRGIKPTSASFFAEDALRWPVVDPRMLKTVVPPFMGLPEPDESSQEHNQRVLRAFIEDNAEALGLRARVGFDLYPLDVARRTAPDDNPQVTLCTQAVQKQRRAGATEPDGVTLVFEGSGRLRYAIQTSRS